MTMKWNRREFLTTSSLALAGAFRSVPALGQAPATTGTFRELRNGVGTFLGCGGTIGWAITPDAFVVVDTQFPDMAEVCLQGLEQRSTRQIDAIINTHHHADHLSGNAVFKPMAKTIVSHERVPGLQRRQAEAVRLEFPILSLNPGLRQCCVAPNVWSQAASAERSLVPREDVGVCWSRR